MSAADFDGIICIGGEDWWYHNRGHFDFQIMRRLAKRWPVLFVNSIGVRFPSPHQPGLFAKRIGRKLKSFTRGVVQVEPNFWVFSPINIPGGAARSLSRMTLAPQIRLAARRAGIARPLVWVHCPAGADVIEDIPNAGLVFQRTDRFEAFPEGDAAVLQTQVGKLKSEADLVVYAARHMLEEERSQVSEPLLVTHGVDTERFIRAGEADASLPADVACQPRPRVGFVGGLDEHTFDRQLFVDVAAAMPDHQFVLVGGSSLPERWCELSNVTMLGRRPYEEIAGYMAAMDCLIMPWNRSDWIKACNPIKLKEYLAVGRPIVSTPFAALEPFEAVVRIADTSAGFVEAIKASLTSPYNAAKARALIQGEDWNDKADLVAEAISRLGMNADDRQAA